ncbi:unnamed protein product, partial [Pylaiella littoralis]
HFVGEGTRAVPVGDSAKRKGDVLRVGFTTAEIREARLALTFLGESLKNEDDKAVLQRFKSLREAFEYLEQFYDPESETATQRLYDKFPRFKILAHGNPVAAFHDLEDLKNRIQEKCLPRVPEPVVHARFVSTLPDEYVHTKETLQSMKGRTREEIVRRVGTRYSNTPLKKGSQRSSRPPEQAFYSSEKGERGYSQRG